MIINNNIPALNTYRQMGINQNAQQSAMEKLSSGLRINRAGDDAAGLAISEKMRAQIRGLDQASRNAQDGISMIQTAEGALDETHSILQRMRELATQAANDTNVEVDREEIQKEINQLTSEINRIGNTTEFNTQKLLDGGGQAAGEIGEPTIVEADLTAPDPDDHVAGTIEFDITTAFEAGDTLTVGGETVTFYATDAERDAAGGLSVSIESAATAEEQAAAIAGLTFTDFTADDNNETLTFEQQTAGDGDLTVSVGTASDDGFSATFQIGANKGQSMTIEIADMRAAALGIAGEAGEAAEGSGDVDADAVFSAEDNVTNGTTNTTEEAALSVLTHEDASAAVEAINQAIETVSAQRSELGAFQNRLEHTISNLDNASENLSAAESRIRDVDYANAA